MTDNLTKSSFPLIFIIEDNKLFLKMVEEHLRLNELTNVKSFTNSKECLDSLYYNPDIIILDYELPETNGLNMLQKIKRTIPDVYVIMLTSSAKLDIALEALKAGAYDFIHKDELSFRLLKSVIQKILNDHKAGKKQDNNFDLTGFKRFLKS